MYLLKSYKIHELLDEPSYVEWRKSTISEITEEKVTFKEDNNQLIRKSLKIKGFKPTEISNTQLKQLADYFDLCYSRKLVHGDLHKKNLISDGNNIFVIDWEPSLRQIILNKNTLMFTAPWIDPIDLKNKELTHNTDLMCFLKLINNINKSYFYTENWESLKKKAFCSKLPFNFTLKYHTEDL